MNSQERSIIYALLVQLFNGDDELTPAQRRSLLNELCKAICNMNIDDILDENRGHHRLLLKRGTSAEHEDFTGMVGEISVDTTNKTLRVHDGTTAGGIPLAKQSEIPAIPEIHVLNPIPDWSAGVDITPPTQNNQYTCPYDGVYVACFIHGANNDRALLVINGIQSANCVSQSDSKNANRQSSCVYLHQGDVIYWTQSMTTGLLYSSTYYPLTEVAND